MRDLSYQSKLMIGICGLVLFLGTAVIWLAHRSARASTESLARSLFQEASSHAATQSRAYVLRASPLAESLVQLANDGLRLDDSDRLATQLLAVLRANEGLSWISYGDESGSFTGVYRPVEGSLRINQSRIADGRTHLVEHDVSPGGSWTLHREEPDSGYDPRNRPFYRKAKEAGRLVWLPPYIFYNQGVPGVSCAAPVFDDNRRLLGVLSIDFDLKELSAFVGAVSLSQHSNVFLFTSDDVLLAHPDWRSIEPATNRVQNELTTIGDSHDPLVQSFSRHRQMRPAARNRTSGFDFLNFSAMA